jgi:iron complex outermembrane receptor protein
LSKSALLLASAFLAAGPALAQQGPTRDASADHHETQGSDIVIVGTLIRDLDILAGTTVVGGTELLRDIRPQIGDTLARQPGVSATSFSPGASRPVLRGFQGERVRVLSDGIGSIDVSNTSADHAVTIDPLTAERIEILHGPAVLLYGSQAIGGAINVLDRRIPRVSPDEPFHLHAIGAYGSAAEERSIGAAIDVPLTDTGLVFHIDGSFRKTGDLEVGGFVLSPELRGEQLEIAAEEAAEGHAEEAAEALELAGQRGRIRNSATEQKTAGAGLALIREGGSLGVSLSWFDSAYGVPGRPGLSHHHGEGGEGEGEAAHGEEALVTIGLEQVRADLRSELNVGGGFLEKIRTRLAYADYTHTEFEGDEVGTVFSNEGFEGRLELLQATRSGWSGASGLQYFNRDFAAVGAEAFLPPNQTDQVGLFTVQQFDLGAAGIEAAARYERTGVESTAVGFDRSFNTLSLAAGASYELSRRVKIGANVSRAERAPAAEELLSNGPHIATQAFEVGDPALAKEKSWGLEAYVRAQTPGYRLSATVFANWFDDYIFQDSTGAEEDGLPVFRYFQRGARYYGFELEGSATLFQAGGFRFVADTVADYVRATIKDGGPVPRIPPLRLLGGIEAQSDNFDGRIEAEWVDDQARVAAFENPTDGHTYVNASLAWHPFGKQRQTVLVLSANNIFDVDARRHASFTKDFVPLAGRDIRVSARVSF